MLWPEALDLLAKTCLKQFCCFRSLPVCDLITSSCRQPLIAPVVALWLRVSSRSTGSSPSSTRAVITSSQDDHLLSNPNYTIFIPYLSSLFSTYLGTRKGRYTSGRSAFSESACDVDESSLRSMEEMDRAHG